MIRNSAAPPRTPEVSQLPWPVRDVRVCLIGYHGVLHEVAAALIEGGIKVAVVVSHMDDSHGKDGPEAFLADNGLFPPMSEVAAATKAPLMLFPDPNAQEVIGQIRETGANVAFSVSAPVLKDRFLEAFDGWVFNYHTSRQYRGRGGLSWSILNGITTDSVVLHWIDSGIDTGDTVIEAPYSWPENAYPIDIFRAQLSAVGDLTRRFVGLLGEGGVPSTSQDPTRPYLPSLITDEDGWIDWNWPPEEAQRVVRAFGWPYAGASSLLQGSARDVPAHIRIARCHVAETPAQALHPLANGAVLFHKRNGSASVACGGRVLHIETLRKDGDEVPAGESIRVGMRLRNRL